MSPNNDPVMPIDPRDCFTGANKFCHDELSEYGFIVDSHFFDQQISLEHQNAVFASVFSKIHDGIFMLDERLRFICVNQQFLNITALPRDQVIGSPFYFYPYKTYAPHLQQAIAAIITKLDNRQSISTNLVLCYHNSPEVAVWLDICVCEVDDNRVVYVGLLTNLAKKDAQLSHTLHLYNYDELTGLPNYDTFYDKLKSCIDYYQAADNQRNCMGVLLRINIDKLQSFNISLGIENTNTLIQGFVKRVKSLKISGASLVTFSRFGGDSFAAMISVQHLDAAHHLQRGADLARGELVVLEHVTGDHHELRAEVGGQEQSIRALAASASLETLAKTSIVVPGNRIAYVEIGGGVSGNVGFR